MEALIDTHLCAILHLHDILRWFSSGGVTGTTIIKSKMNQDLSSTDQDSLFLVYLYLRKAYNTEDQERILMILEGYGAGPHLCGIMKTFWCQHQVVPRQHGFHGLDLPATRVITQGGLLPLTLLNVVVYNVIRTWMAMTVKDHRVAHDRLGETSGWCLGFLYTNYGMVG